MIKNPRLIDLTGKRFGKWTVICQDGNTRGGAALWLCVCDCGGTGKPTGGDLRAGKSTSCTCSQSIAAKKTFTKHAGKGTRLHRIWVAMRTRCRNPNTPSFRHYGEKGITVCEEWNTFTSFRDWALSAGYADNLSIERRDNSKNYCPENCTFANAQQQAANRTIVRKNKDGIAWCDIAKSNGIRVVLMHSRLHEGWSIEQACTLPINTRIAPLRLRDEKTGRYY